MNPDPAAHLWGAEAAAWADYHGERLARPELRERWHRIITEIQRLRRDAGWPYGGPT